MKNKILLSLAILALSTGAMAQRSSFDKLGDTKAAKEMAAELAGHTFVANPADDEANLNDPMEDSSALRKIVFGSDGSCSLLYPSSDDAGLSFSEAAALDTTKGELCTWSVSIPNSCGDAGCAPFLNVTFKNSRRTTNFGLDYDAAKGQMRVELFHSNSVLLLVK